MEKREIDYSSITKKIGQGAESDVYLYKDKNGYDVALKIFKRKIKVYKNGKMKYIDFDEKMQKNIQEKLQLLDRDICMYDEPKLFDLMYDEYLGFVGYTMEYMDLPSLDDMTGKFGRKKIELLTKLKNKIEEFNRNGVYIGDFTRGNNFLIDNNGEIRLIDVDNFNVHGLNFDLTNGHMDCYFNRNDSVKNIDNYCFNMYTISFYTRVIMPELLVYLREYGLPDKFRTKENVELLHDMLTKSNYEKRYILDNRKKGLF